MVTDAVGLVSITKLAKKTTQGVAIYVVKTIENYRRIEIINVDQVTSEDMWMNCTDKYVEKIIISKHASSAAAPV